MYVWQAECCNKRILICKEEMPSKAFYMFDVWNVKSTVDGELEWKLFLVKINF